MEPQDRRKRLASLSFSDKIKILAKLRDRSLAIAARGLRKTQLSPEGPSSPDGIKGRRLL
jgi:hypothetical protein